jgi:hypothetical protein
MEEQDWVVEVKTGNRGTRHKEGKSSKGRVNFGQTLKHVTVLLLGYDAMMQSYPHHSLHGLNHQTGGGYWLRTGRNGVDTAKVMIALSMAALARRIEARMNWKEMW